MYHSNPNLNYPIEICRNSCGKISGVKNADGHLQQITPYKMQQIYWNLLETLWGGVGHTGVGWGVGHAVKQPKK